LRPSRLVVAALTCALALVSTGCTDQLRAVRSVYQPPLGPQTSAAPTPEEPTVGQLWTSFQTSLARARSMRITGVVQLSGKAATVDLSGTCDGTQGRSTITMDNQNLEVTTVGGTHYVKANAAYWRASGLAPGVIVEIGSRYLATKDPSLSRLTVGGFLGSLRTEQAVTDGMGVIAERTTLTGRPVYLFSVRTTGGRLTIWVTDTAYTLLKLRYETTAGTDEVTFSDWDVPVSYSAPPPAQVIRL
jgi:hypothetical protein